MRWLQLLFFSVGLAAAPTIKVSPSALTFTFQQGAAALPAPQTLAVSAVTGSPASPVYVSTGGSPWLTFTPLSGRTALSVKVSVNPTTLPAGEYTENVTLSTPESGGDPVTIPLTLTVRPPASDIRVTPPAIAITYRLGDGGPDPAFTQLSTTGGLLSFTASVAGAKWMRVTPASGAVFPGFRTNVTVTVDPADLVPGSQKGAIAISAPDAITKSISIPVVLTVQPGQPYSATIWPPRISRGAPETTVTITGERFYSGTSVKSGSIALRSTVLGPNLLTAVVPASLMTSAGSVPIVVSNPDPGGGSSDPVNLEVLPPGPILLGVVNAASQRPSALAPGAVFTLYGTGLGPNTLVAFDGATPFVPTTMANTRVLLNGVALPVIYSSSRQVSAAAPNNLLPDRPYMLEVEFNGIKSHPFPVLSVTAAPAIFTANSSGTGNAAAFQADAVTGELAFNSDKTPAVKGNIVVFYATGAGLPLPLRSSGFVATEASLSPIARVSVIFGDVPAVVQYAGAAPGLITGIVQINAVVPDDTPTGKAVPITLKIGDAASQPGVTLNVK